MDEMKKAHEKENRATHLPISVEFRQAMKRRRIEAENEMYDSLELVCFFFLGVI